MKNYLKLYFIALNCTFDLPIFLNPLLFRSFFEKESGTLLNPWERDRITLVKNRN